MFNTSFVGNYMQEQAALPLLSMNASTSLFQLFYNHRTTLIKFATHITGCYHRAEDIVQDAFFRLDTSLIGGLPLKAQLSYMFQTIRNLSIDNYRKQALEQRYAGTEQEGLNVETQTGATPENIYINQETLKIIASALNELPERTRYAFEMHRVNGMSQKDIAQELGVSPTLVNFMIRDALIHCKKAISNIEQDHSTFSKDETVVNIQ